MNCEPCANEGKDRPATHVYEMFTVRGDIPVCAEHAHVMQKWSGTLRPIDPQNRSALPPSR